RYSIGDAVLSPGNPRLDRPAWRAHRAAHHGARAGSGGGLAALPLTFPRPTIAKRFPLGHRCAPPAHLRYSTRSLASPLLRNLAFHSASALICRAFSKLLPLACPVQV